jgi:hypothetical protein
MTPEELELWTMKFWMALIIGFLSGLVTAMILAEGFS